jgi:hypothetical protein
MRDFNVGKKVAHTKEQNCKGETANSLNSLFVFLVSERQVEVLLTSASRGVQGGASTYYAVVYTIISHLAELI